MSAKPKESRAARQQPPRTGVALLATIFKEQMEQTETVIVDGRRKKLSRLEIIVKQLLNRALAGDDRAVKDLIFLVKKAGNWRENRPNHQILVLLGADAYL